MTSNMFLGMQDFDFAQILPKFAQTYQIYQNFTQIYPKFTQILPKSAQILPKKIFFCIPSSYGTALYGVI